MSRPPHARFSRAEVICSQLHPPATRCRRAALAVQLRWRDVMLQRNQGPKARSLLALQAAVKGWIHRDRLRKLQAVMLLRCNHAAKVSSAVARWTTRT